MQNSKKAQKQINLQKRGRLDELAQVYGSDSSDEADEESNHPIGSQTSITTRAAAKQL